MAQDQKRKKNTYRHSEDRSLVRPMPQATDVEQAVLGALMIDKDAFIVVSDVLCPEAFYEPRNQKIYRAIQTLSMDEKPVDIITVTDELAKEGTLEDVGGPGYVLELSSKVASSANIVYHSRIIVQKYLARQLINFASMIETKAFESIYSDCKELIKILAAITKTQKIASNDNCRWWDLLFLFAAGNICRAVPLMSKQNGCCCRTSQYSLRSWHPRHRNGYRCGGRFYSP